MATRDRHDVTTPGGGPLAFLLAMTALIALLAIAPPAAAQDGIDGEVTPGEYPLSVSVDDGAFELHWDFVNETSIKLAIRAKATGMVALGIEPTRRMKDADMIIGWRTPQGVFEVHDAWSIDETGPHPDDTEQGGTYDIRSYNVTQEGGITTIELTRDLDTGDELDRRIPTEGEVRFIWATSDTDDFSSYHTARGTITVDIGTGEFESVTYPGLWPFHAFFMGAATICFVATWFTVVYKKRFKNRFLDVHHWLGSAGFLLALVGLGIGFYMVSQLDAGHIRISHSILGAADIAVGVLTVAVGSLFIMRKELKRRTRKPHIYLGGLAIILMAITALAGLVYVFPT